MYQERDLFEQARMAAGQAYLLGEGSSRGVAKRYGISHQTVIRYAQVNRLVA